MEFWPADFRADATASTKQKCKGKEVYRLNEQIIEPGTLGAATLTLGNATPQWVSAVQPSSENIPRLVGKSVEVFPPTKLPPIRVPRLTIHQRAEQGARFLRTYHPDVDISFELIKDELQSDEEEAAVDSVLDPYAGNRLAQLTIETQRKQLIRFLAFSCGETGSELNMSPFRPTRDKRLLFRPSAEPALVFDTPIQQIAAFAPKETASRKFPLLAVRTHAVVSIVKLQGSTSSHADGPLASAKTVTPISVSETGNRRIVDMSCGLFSSSNAQILLVNDMGAVYNCRLQGGNKALSLTPDVPVSEDSELDHFWRLAWRDVNACMRASGKKVHMFDLRARSALPRELFHLKGGREYLTSLEAPSNGRHTMCFATTSKLLWFDERNFKRPIFSLKHQRAFDRSLRVESVATGQSTLTTLSSSANHLVTMYDVNYASSGYIQLHGKPFLLPGSPNLDIPVAGSLFFRRPDDGDRDFSHFQLSSRGSLWKSNFSYSGEPTVQVAADVNNDFEWTEEIHALAKKAMTMTEYIGTLSEREYVDADLREIYEKVFNIHEPAQILEEDAEAIYQTLEKMPFFWQDMSGPAEHMLTTFDVAFQSGSEPLRASRADFLTESLLSSTRGFMALTRGRIPIPRLISTVRWYHDLSCLPLAMVPNMPTPSQVLVDQLREEALAQAATPQGMKRATEATQNLVLDLALSRHVYAPQSFTRTGVDASDELDDAEILSQATKAMSLGSAEPPSVHFGFLRPMARPAYEDEEQMESEDDSKSDLSLEIPLGVRLLVHEWELGSRPEGYSYKDPYDEQDTPLTPIPTRKKTRGAERTQPPRHASIPAVVTAPRPPLVVASTSRQTMNGQMRPPDQTASMFETQPTPNEEVSLGGSQQGPDPITYSQVLPGPSTQPLPGPFGGSGRHLGGSKKKIVKKRMGGF